MRTSSFPGKLPNVNRREGVPGERGAVQAAHRESTPGQLRGSGELAYINANFTDMFGYVLKDVPIGGDWLRRAFPDPTYRKAVVSEWQGVLESVKSGEIITRTFEVTCKDGSKKWSSSGLSH